MKTYHYLLVNKKVGFCPYIIMCNIDIAHHLYSEITPKTTFSQIYLIDKLYT